MDVSIQHIQNWLIQKKKKSLIYSNNDGSLFVQKHVLKKDNYNNFFIAIASLYLTV